MNFDHLIQAGSIYLLVLKATPIFSKRNVRHIRWFLEAKKHQILLELYRVELLFFFYTVQYFAFKTKCVFLELFNLIFYNTFFNYIILK